MGVVGEPGVEAEVTLCVKGVESETEVSGDVTEVVVELVSI